MAFVPDTIIHLLNMPIEKDYKHQIYFSTKEAQTSFMMSKVVSGMTFNNLTYQRKDNIIRIPKHVDTLYKCNYVMYQNRNYSNKWFYAFITEMKYENDGNTHVKIETDVYQTWMFDITFKKSFVEREHVLDDKVGNHTYPEGLQLGEYVSNTHYKSGKLNGTLQIVVGSTEVPSGEGTDIGGTYNGLYSGVKYYCYGSDGAGTSDALQYLADAGKIDAVSSLFLAPDFILPTAGGGAVSDSTSVKSFTIERNKMTKLNGYTPKNKKLLTYPYCYFLATNGNGASAIYKQELFSTEKATMKVIGALTPGCSIRMFPLSYKGATENFDEGLNLGKYPQLNWATDMYTNWLTQNAVNMALSVGNSTQGVIGGAVAGMVTGGPAGAMAGAVAGGGISSISSVTSALNQMYLADREPPQMGGNVNCGDVVTASKNNTFHIYDMTIKKEYASIIDNFFEMFGYKVNQMKIPNLSGRPYWNYVKTIECNIDGDIPQDDMMKIKEMFNTGVTLWKDGNNVENYSLDNH